MLMRKVDEIMEWFTLHKSDITFQIDTFARAVEILFFIYYYRRKLFSYTCKYSFHSWNFPRYCFHAKEGFFFNFQLIEIFPTELSISFSDFNSIKWTVHMKFIFRGVTVNFKLSCNHAKGKYEYSTFLASD